MDWVVGYSLDITKKVLELGVLVLRPKLISLDYAKDSMKEGIVPVGPVIPVPSLEQECHKAGDHNLIAGEQILNLVKWYVLGVSRRPEHLTHKVVRSVETGHLDQMWELIRT